MADRQHQTFRANFKGINTRLNADGMPVGKYPLAINVIADGDSRIRTRPGYTIAFSTAARLTDMRAYATLGTDEKPRILVHDSSGGVWLDNGVKKGTVGFGGIGASLVTYRPNQSPQTWMYVANSTGYSKFSSPDASNNVTVQKTGIAEPQSPPDACPDGRQFNDFTGNAASWTPALIAGATSNATRSTDTVVAIFQDPASVAPAQLTRYSVQVSTGSTKIYQTDEELTFNKLGGGTITAVVEDVFPPVNAGTALQVLAIYIAAPGHAVIVPSQMAVGADKPQFDSSGDPIAATTSSDLLSGQIADLRRGSLVQIGTEVCLVLNVVAGPLGNVTFEAAVTQVHNAGETIIGIPAIACSGLTSLVVGQTVTSAEIDSTFTFSAGNNIGTLSQTFGTNPFNQSLGTIGPPQEDDLIHISLKIDAPQNITAFRIVFDVGDGSFTQNTLYYEVNVNALQFVVTNTQTQLSAVTTAENQALIVDTATGYDANSALGNNQKVGRGQPARNIGSLQTGILQLGTGTSQWTELTFPITELTRVGTDQTKTLMTAVGVQILLNCTATVHLGIGSLWVGGGGQLDIGQTGSPYFYRVRPRSVTTGARGNPSPSMRHGLYNRLQPNILSLPSAAYDAQIEVWDIERYGGTVTSWRLVGTAQASAATYVDNALDAAANAGEALDFDNFEPWPTVDIPFTATVGVNGITAINVIGTIVTILGPPGSFPTTIMRWLPGTLITLNGQLTYTLNSRPQPIAGGVLFFIADNAGAPTVTTAFVNEPFVAAQPLPYVWGPDANGVIFACGDPIRPGALYSSKQFAPDATPNNIYDLTPPSEPLLGGEIIDGVSIVASSKRWWQLQAAFSTPQRWNPIEIPVGRGLGAPFGHCTDGKLVYFWAKDGIYGMIPGLPASSLTDADIGNLFPQDGVSSIPADIRYSTFIIQAPNYAYAAQFRLSIINNILRAHYFDRSGVARILRLDMSLDSGGQPRMAWSVDQPFDQLSLSYQPEQPASTLQSVNTAYTQGYLADVNGNVYTEADFANDNTHPIPCAIAVPEWDAGDHRIPKQWFDAFIDIEAQAVPGGGVSLNPIYQRSAVSVPFLIGTRTTRQLTINPLGSLAAGFPVQNFLGLSLTYSDDLGNQGGKPTIFHAWTYEYALQPMLIRSWQSVPTAHGLQGYHFIYRIRFAFVSFSTVTLTITAFDGTSPASITLPNTNGAYQKIEFIPTFNKGLLFTYQGTTIGAGLPWAPIVDQCEVLVGQWGRKGPCTVFRGLGGVENT